MVASISKAEWQGCRTGSSEQADNLTASSLEPETQASGQHWRLWPGPTEFLGAKSKQPFQTAVTPSHPCVLHKGQWEQKVSQKNPAQRFSPKILWREQCSFQMEKVLTQ